MKKLLSSLEYYLYFKGGLDMKRFFILNQYFYWKLKTWKALVIQYKNL